MAGSQVLSPLKLHQNGGYTEQCCFKHYYDGTRFHGDICTKHYLDFFPNHTKSLREIFIAHYNCMVAVSGHHLKKKFQKLILCGKKTTELFFSHTISTFYAQFQLWVVFVPKKLKLCGTKTTELFFFRTISTFTHNFNFLRTKITQSCFCA